MDELSRDEVLQRLRGLVTYERRQVDIARELDISPVFVSAVLSGKKEPSQKMLDLIGIERIVTFIYKPRIKKARS